MVQYYDLHNDHAHHRLPSLISEFLIEFGSATCFIIHSFIHLLQSCDIHYYNELFVDLKLNL